MFRYKDTKWGPIKILNVTETRANLAKVLSDKDNSYVITKNNRPERVVINYDLFEILQNFIQNQQQENSHSTSRAAPSQNNDNDPHHRAEHQPITQPFSERLPEAKLIQHSQNHKEKFKENSATTTSVFIQNNSTEETLSTTTPSQSNIAISHMAETEELKNPDDDYGSIANSGIWQEPETLNELSHNAHESTWQIIAANENEDNQAFILSPDDLPDSDPHDDMFSSIGMEEDQIHQQLSDPHIIFAEETEEPAQPENQQTAEMSNTKPESAQPETESDYFKRFKKLYQNSSNSEPINISTTATSVLPTAKTQQTLTPQHDFDFDNEVTNPDQDYNTLMTEEPQEISNNGFTAPEEFEASTLTEIVEGQPEQDTAAELSEKTSEDLDIGGDLPSLHDLLKDLENETLSEEQGKTDDKKIDDIVHRLTNGY